MAICVHTAWISPRFSQHRTEAGCLHLPRRWTSSSEVCPVDLSIEAPLCRAVCSTGCSPPRSREVAA
eukprot:3300347-Pyramimonas_sp.AAC.1